MLKFSLVLIVLFATFCCYQSNDELQSNGMLTMNLNEIWSLWTTSFNKVYLNNREELKRRIIWEDNLRHIQQHNILFDLGKQTYTMGLNQFSDLTFEEFKQIYLMANIEKKFDDKINLGYYLPPLNVNYSVSSVDWRNKGYVTPVKNQGQCGSCWAFSTTGGIEGQYFRKFHNLKSFSEQQLVDCDHIDHGCEGGWMYQAYRYINNAGGITTESRYPYNGTVNPVCKFHKSMAVTTVIGYFQVHPQERALASVTTTEGPISIAIAVNSNFQHYKSGIYSDSTCNNKPVNHAVLVVGFSDIGQHFWIVKNSWSDSWGEKGYIRMAKDKNNICSIANYAFFPVL